jgi:proline iminopeptidase
MLYNQEKKVDIKGINHWVKIAGAQHKTIPIVIVHGGPGGHQYAFEHTIGIKLETLFTVIYYEQRGSGRSDAPKDDKDYKFQTLVSDLEDLCVVLELDKIILLGYSFGGEIVLEYTQKYPHRVEKVIVEAPSIMTDLKLGASIQLKGFKEVANEEELKILNEIDIKNISGADLMNYIWDHTSSETHSKFLFYDQANAQRMYGLWSEAWEKKKLANTGKMADVIIHETYTEHTLNTCKNIKCETLIVIGEQDRNCGIELAKAYHQAIKDSKLVVVSQAAHFVDFEQEDIFFEEVRRFIQS